MDAPDGDCATANGGQPAQRLRVPPRSAQPEPPNQRTARHDDEPIGAELPPRVGAGRTHAGLGRQSRPTVARLDPEVRRHLRPARPVEGLELGEDGNRHRLTSEHPPGSVDAAEHDLVVLLDEQRVALALEQFEDGPGGWLRRAAPPQPGGPCPGGQHQPQQAFAASSVAPVVMTPGCNGGDSSTGRAVPATTFVIVAGRSRGHSPIRSLEAASRGRGGSP